MTQFDPEPYPQPVMSCSCTVDNETAVEKGLQFVHEGHPCEQMSYPEPIGLVQASLHLQSTCISGLIPPLDTYTCLWPFPKHMALMLTWSFMSSVNLRYKSPSPCPMIPSRRTRSVGDKSAYLNACEQAQWA
jgi:hypothetical protein